LGKRCIDEETLADFLEGRLPKEGRAAVAEHLADCDRCLDMIKIGGGLVRGGEMTGTFPVPDDITAAAIKSVELAQKGRLPSAAARVSSSLKGVSVKVARWFLAELESSPQLMPVRGDWKAVSGTVIQVKKNFRSFEIGIEIEKVENQTATIRITLLSDEKRCPSTRVTLKKNAREVSSDIMDGKLVVFESIPFDRYSLVFSREGATMGCYKFEIKETLNES